jgi:hypothetical protein
MLLHRRTPNNLSHLDIKHPRSHRLLSYLEQQLSCPKRIAKICTLFIKIVGIDMTLTGSDSMGAVTEGVLRILCEALLSGMILS